MINSCIQHLRPESEVNGECPLISVLNSIILCHYFVFYFVSVFCVLCRLMYLFFKKLSNKVRRTGKIYIYIFILDQSSYKVS